MALGSLRSASPTAASLRVPKSESLKRLSNASRIAGESSWVIEIEKVAHSRTSGSESSMSLSNVSKLARTIARSLRLGIGSAQATLQRTSSKGCSAREISQAAASGSSRKWTALIREVMTSGSCSLAIIARIIAWDSCG